MSVRKFVQVWFSIMKSIGNYSVGGGVKDGISWIQPLIANV
jgi:hypothetical protein